MVQQLGSNKAPIPTKPISFLKTVSQNKKNNKKKTKTNVDHAFLSFFLFVKIFCCTFFFFYFTNFVSAGTASNKSPTNP